jgi:4-amino-4-deoxy-L-arabinose transferase-like glycosyltransferase
VTAASVAVRAADLLGARRHADVAAACGLAAFTGALVAATWGTWGDLDSDTGYDVVAGARVADGELPYRDFTYYYGPLAPFVSGLAALAGGEGLGPAVALGLAIALAIVAATFALARAVLGPLGAFFAAAITAAVAFIPSNYSFVLPHTFAATLGTLFLLLVLLGLWRYTVTGSSRWAVAAGAALGLATLTKPEPAAAATLAVVVWLLYRARTGAGARLPASLVAGPALAVPVLAYGSIMTVVSPGVLLLENLWPVDELEAGGSTLVRARMPLSVESVDDLLRHSLPYAAGVLALLGLARLLERPGRHRRPLLAACALAGLVFVAACVARPDGLRDGLYYAYGWIPLGALVAVIVVGRRIRRGRTGAPAGIELAGAVALLVLAVTTYNGFVFHGWRPNMAHYYVPLAAVLVARIHLVELARSRTAYVLNVAWVALLLAAGTGLALKDARSETVVVSGPGGALAETPAEGAAYQAALDEIATRTEPGEPILAAPLMTGLHVLSGHESPLPELSLLPGALPGRADQLAAAEELDRAGVRLVLTNRREWLGYGHGAFGETFDQVLAGWIERNFDRVATLPARGTPLVAIDVWVRRDSS